MLPNNKDAAKIILSKLDDKDLLNACLTDKRTNSLCDESFFRNRTIARFTDHLEKPENITWRHFYLECVYYMDKLGIHYNTYGYIDNATHKTPKQYYEKYDNECVLTASKNGLAIKNWLYPSEKVQLAAVNDTPCVIEFIKNPSEKVQLLAVTKHPDFIAGIKNPTEKVQLKAVSVDETSIRNIKNPSAEIQLAAVAQNKSAYLWIVNPTQKVLELSRKI